MGGSSSVRGDETIYHTDNMSFDGTDRGGKMTTNGQLWIGATASDRADNGGHVRLGQLVSPDASITFGYSAPNITAVVTGGAPYISLTPYIVGPDIHSGFATIASAISQAASDGASSSNPKNIYIKPQNGGYTENLTLSDGINLIGFGSSFFNAPSTTKITGKITMTATGTASVSNLDLQTNGDYVLQVTGANVLNVILSEVFINATNANAINITNANAGIQLFRCQGFCSTNAYFIATAGGINAHYCILTSANTTTNSTIANCSLQMFYSFMSAPVTTSGTGAFGAYSTQLFCTNTTALTHGGSGTSIAYFSRFDSGTASAVSIGAAATLPMVLCTVDSSNANAITGAGVLEYGIIVFTGASSTVNTTTQTALPTLI